MRVQIIKPEKKNGSSKVFKNGEIVKLSQGRTGVIIKKYSNYYRVKVTAGEGTYNECFFEEDLYEK